MRALTSIIILLFSLASCDSEVSPNIVTTDLMGYDLGSGEELMGTARATFSNNITTLSISLINQVQGTIRAVHIYDGTCENPLEIWNMGSEQNYCDQLSLGDRWAKPYLGNIGNVVIKGDGTGEFQISTDLWSVGTGWENDLSLKTIIVHAGPENFMEECDPNHVPDHFHPNTMIACGTLN